MIPLVWVGGLVLSGISIRNKGPQQFAEDFVRYFYIGAGAILDTLEIIGEYGQDTAENEAEYVHLISQEQLFCTPGSHKHWNDFFEDSPAGSTSVKLSTVAFDTSSMCSWTAPPPHNAMFSFQWMYTTLIVMYTGVFVVSIVVRLYLQALRRPRSSTSRRTCRRFHTQQDNIISTSSSTTYCQASHSNAVDTAGPRTIRERNNECNMDERQSVLARIQDANDIVQVPGEAGSVDEVSPSPISEDEQHSTPRGSSSTLAASSYTEIPSFISGTSTLFNASDIHTLSSTLGVNGEICSEAEKPFSQLNNAITVTDSMAQDDTPLRETEGSRELELKAAFLLIPLFAAVASLSTETSSEATMEGTSTIFDASAIQSASSNLRIKDDLLSDDQKCSSTLKDAMPTVDNIAQVFSNVAAPSPANQSYSSGTTSTSFDAGDIQSTSSNLGMKVDPLLRSSWNDALVDDLVQGEALQHPETQQYEIDVSPPSPSSDVVASSVDASSFTVGASSTLFNHSNIHSSSSSLWINDELFSENHASRHMIPVNDGTHQDEDESPQLPATVEYESDVAPFVTAPLNRRISLTDPFVYLPISEPLEKRDLRCARRQRSGCPRARDVYPGYRSLSDSESPLSSPPRRKRRRRRRRGD